MGDTEEPGSRLCSTEKSSPPKSASCSSPPPNGAARLVTIVPPVIVNVVAFAECGSSVTRAMNRASVVFIGPPTHITHHSDFFSGTKRSGDCTANILRGQRKGRSFNRHQKKASSRRIYGHTVLSWRVIDYGNRRASTRKSSRDHQRAAAANEPHGLFNLQKHRPSISVAVRPGD